VAEYRWERASGGAAPEGAPQSGHGCFRVPDEEERHPMWAVRSLPGADGSVRLGHLSSSGGAFVGESEEEQGENVDEYEVLLDEGTWAPSQDGDLGAAGAPACGHLGDGTPLSSRWETLGARGLEPRWRPGPRTTGATHARS
jgi:hypothetical protein